MHRNPRRAAHGSRSSHVSNLAQEGVVEVGQIRNLRSCATRQGVTRQIPQVAQPWRGSQSSLGHDGDIVHCNAIQAL